MTTTVAQAVFDDLQKEKEQIVNCQLDLYKYADPTQQWKSYWRKEKKWQQSTTSFDVHLAVTGILTSLLSPAQTLTSLSVGGADFGARWKNEEGRRVQEEKWKIIMIVFIANLNTSNFSSWARRFGEIKTYNNKEPRTRTFLGVSLPREIAQRFDQERGLVSRSTWFRHILETRYGMSSNNNNAEQQKQKAGTLSQAPSSAESEPAHAVVSVGLSHNHIMIGAAGLTQEGLPSTENLLQEQLPQEELPSWAE
jgi:hypothetical protein